MATVQEMAREWRAKWICSDDAFRRRGELLSDWHERELATFHIYMMEQPSSKREDIDKQFEGMAKDEQYKREALELAEPQLPPAPVGKK